MGEKRVMRITNPKNSYEPEEGVQNTETPPAPDNVAKSKFFAVGPAVKRAWRAVKPTKGGG